MGRLHRILAGTDGPGKRAIPAGEFLHPVPLAALIVLGVNDHVLKGSGWLPQPVVGKLSDIAGFVFFPLLCTALVDCALWGAAHLGARVDFSLRMWKLWLAMAFTAGLMSAIKLSTRGAEVIVGFLGHLGFPSQIMTDWTDLLTMPAMALAYWVGRGQIARVPLGRIEVIERSGAPAGPQLADCRARGDASAVDALAAALDRGDSDAASAALEALRGA